MTCIYLALHFSSNATEEEKSVLNVKEELSLLLNDTVMRIVKRKKEMKKIEISLNEFLNTVS